MQLKESPARSWFTPSTSRALSAALNARIRERMQGKRGLFITLTYDPDLFSGPLDAYRRARQERHVRRFIERLGEHLGRSLTGKWCRKLEFQGNGMPHWHLVIECPNFIPREEVARLWGWGFVDVKRTTQRRLEYFAKYMSKPTDLPGWLLAERWRSVRVVSASPGFWGPIEYVRRRRRRRKPFPAYVTVGDRLGRSGRVVVRDRRGGSCSTLRLTFRDLLRRMSTCGAAMRAVGDGWFEISGGSLARLVESSAAAPAAAELDLIPMRKPPDTGTLPAWIGRFLEAQELASWRRAA